MTHYSVLSEEKKTCEHNTSDSVTRPRLVHQLCVCVRGSVCVCVY